MLDINFILRASAMFLRAMFIVFLAKVASFEVINQYGVVTVFIGLFMTLMGGELYTIFQREIANSDDHRKGAVVLLYVRFMACSIAIFFPIVLYVVIYWMQFEALIGALVLTIVLMEFLSQEANRILIVLDRRLEATVVFFVRVGLWCCLFILYASLFAGTVTDLDTLLMLWAACSASATTLAWAAIYRSTMAGYFARRTPDEERLPLWLFLKVNSGQVAAMFFSVVAIRFVAFFDRYTLNETFNNEFLSTYIILQSAAASINSVIISTFLANKVSTLLDKGTPRETYLAILIRSMKLFAGLLALAVAFLLVIFFDRFGTFVERYGAVAFLIALSQCMLLVATITKYYYIARSRLMVVFYFHLVAIVSFVGGYLVISNLVKPDPLVMMASLVTLFYGLLAVQLVVAFRRDT